LELNRPSCESNSWKKKYTAHWPKKNRYYTGKCRI
jgi:hypothetical protein